MDILPTPQTGWLCPRCGAVNAPWVPSCGCPHKVQTWAGTGVVTYSGDIQSPQYEMDLKNK